MDVEQAGGRHGEQRGQLASRAVGGGGRLALVAEIGRGELVQRRVIQPVLAEIEIIGPGEPVDLRRRIAAGGR
jgi:hypothetical protein